MVVHVEQFFSRAEQDEQLRSQLAHARTNDDVVCLAAKLGFHFTKEEYEQRLDASLGIDDIESGGAVMSGISQCPSHWPT